MLNASGHGGKVLISVLLGTFTVSLNNSALNLAVAELMVTFEASATGVSWVVTLFMITMGMTMPLTGYLADRFGRRSIYLLGLWGFLAGSALGAMAQSLAGIILARGLQGVAAGLMIPLSLSLIFSAYPADQRGRASGIWGFAVMLAPALGPSVGGLLLEVSHWRALFLMNMPFALLGLICGYRYLPAEAANRRRRFDLPGFALITLGMGAVLFSLSRVETLNDLGRTQALLPLTAGLLALVLFVRTERRTHTPLLDLSLFTHQGYRLSVILACLQSIILFGCILLVPLWMQNALEFDPLTTGLVFLATALAASSCSPIAGRLIDRYPPQWCIGTGLTITMISLVGLATLTKATPVWMIGAWMGLRGLGLGCAYLPSTTVGMKDLPESHVAQASAMNNMSRRLVSSLGIVALTLYYDTAVKDALDRGIPYTEASATALHHAFLALAAVAVCCMPLAWRLGRAVTRHDAAPPDTVSLPAPPLDRSFKTASVRGSE
ncbi:DHA2 family efflux MFS transporter permease subunit [Aidingimonas halophila]|uniref:Drug resistance transporter, EmrB/QacA subfamily n=1 Tax=Aidingimonas halophila TaxID=574349 RepID=A0A1H2U5F7_9GAMM|nr:DHA2 family efflux MFS transporter permease subunit [Aidingimonas halophila]GHC22197.1 MFS transporter [Aidingimonas halophila]SDW51167.1 drug resistance transporter, EmrB/QacA subfamily [Aidingimonas halophila]